MPYKDKNQKRDNRITIKVDDDLRYYLSTMYLIERVELNKIVRRLLLGYAAYLKREQERNPDFQMRYPRNDEEFYRMVYSEPELSEVFSDFEDESGKAEVEDHREAS